MRTTYLDIGKSILNGATADEILTNYPDAHGVLCAAIRADSHGFRTADAIIVFARLLDLITSDDKYHSEEWEELYGDLETFKIIRRLRLHSSFMSGDDENLSRYLKLGRFMGYGNLVLCLASDVLASGEELRHAERFVDDVNLKHNQYKFLLRLQKEFEDNPPRDAIGAATSVYRIDPKINIANWNGAGVGIRGGIMSWHQRIVTADSFIEQVSSLTTQLSPYSDFQNIPPRRS